MFALIFIYTGNEQMFDIVKKQLISLIDGENNFIANAANFASLLYHSFEKINWAGFYFCHGNELLLGPFQGKTACIRIPFEKGVCGAAVRNRETVIVPDVHEFEGHIPCDSASESEIVIPIIQDSFIYGVLDIDSPVKNRFTETEKQHFEDYLSILINQSDIGSLKKYYNLATN